MTVQAQKLVNRDIYEITYDPGNGHQMVATMTNPKTGDVSQVRGPDDGKFQVTVAAGYEGEADYVIFDLSGNELDTGHVVYGADTPVDPTEPPVEPAGPVDPDYGIDEGTGAPIIPDNELPGSQPHPDQGLPEDQPHPDQGLPGEQPEVNPLEK